MVMSEGIDKIMPELLKVKIEMESITKDAKNPHFKSSFASLNSYLESLEPILQKHKLVLLQPITNDHVESIIIHSESGQFVSSSLKIVSKNIDDVQQRCASVTYNRRYTLASLLACVADDDDDGNTATGKNVKPQSSQTYPASPPRRGFGGNDNKPTTNEGFGWNS